MLRERERKRKKYEKKQQPNVSMLIETEKYAAYMMYDITINTNIGKLFVHS